jgi:hypothetical protein
MLLHLDLRRSRMGTQEASVEQVYFPLSGVISLVPPPQTLSGIVQLSKTMQSRT